MVSGFCHSSSSRKMQLLVATGRGSAGCSKDRLAQCARLFRLGRREHTMLLHRPHFARKHLFHRRTSSLSRHDRGTAQQLNPALLLDATRNWYSTTLRRVRES